MLNFAALVQELRIPLPTPFKATLVPCLFLLLLASQTADAAEVLVCICRALSFEIRVVLFWG
jgi:hypothetical protein